MNWTYEARRAAIGSLALWIVFAATYILLRSHDYVVVDGALRCLAIYWRRPPYLGSNNHLLFLTDALLWSHALGHLGFHPAGPIAFVGSIQAMNAICAGGCVALVNLLAWRFTRSLKLALAAAIFVALSWAMLKHATNSSEPVVGLFISLIATMLVTEGLARARYGLLFAGGAGLSLAMANYQAMFLIAPLLYLFCVTWPRPGLSPADALREGLALPTELAAMRRPLLNLCACVGGTIAGAIAIYGTAYHSLGIPGLQPMLRAFVELAGESVYGGLSITKLVNLPTGIVGNLLAVLPENFQGIGWLLMKHRDARSIAMLAAIGLIVALALVMIARAAIRRCDSRDNRLVGAAIIAALLLELYPLLYYGSLYDKFWLQPFATLAVCGAIAASWMDAGSVRRLSFLVMLLIGLEALMNLSAAIAAHSSPTPCLEDARTVAAAIHADDRVVVDFDPVSTLWMALYDRQPSRTLLLPATPPAVSLETLERWNGECARSGCGILFIAVLDHSRDEWDPFLGKHVGIPFDSFDRYRDSSRTVKRFACEPAGLRIYAPRSLGN